MFLDLKTETKGVILALHGYTACPQQYFEWANTMSEQGYEVLVPLHPGHGYVRVEDKEQIKYVPDVKNYNEKYGAFIKDMNAIIASYPKLMTKHIAGLSLGGAMVSYAFKLFT